MGIANGTAGTVQRNCLLRIAQDRSIGVLSNIENRASGFPTA
jgi:hypothetical protein